MILSTRWIALTLVATFAAGCGGEANNPPEVPRHIASSSASQASTGGPIPVASVPNGSVGPYLARGASGALLVWAQTGPDSGWFARTLDKTGSTLGPARRIAAVDSAVRLVRLVPFGTEYLLVWTLDGVERGVLEALVVNESGEAVTAPVRVADLASPALWLDFVPSTTGGLLFWAERSHELAALYAVSLDRDAAPGRRVIAVHPEARAWQIAGTDEGAVAATVTRARQLELATLPAHGEQVARTRVAGAERVNSEVDLVRAGDRLILGYSASPLVESHVYSAVLDLAGAPLSVPRLALEPYGEQALVRLVSGSPGSDPFLVWQDVDQAPEQLKVARLDGEGKARSEVVVLPWDGQHPMPEFHAQDRELRALLWSCVSKAGCVQPQVPTLLGFDETLRPSWVAPWVLGNHIPDLAWDLRCSESQCWGLAAKFGEPTNVYALGAESASEQWRVPAWNPLQRSPRTSSSQAILESLELSEFDAQESAAGTLIAWLSYFDPNLPYVIPSTPAPDGRRAPVRAQLHTQWVPADLDPGGNRDQLPDSEVISYRARSFGGLALARGEGRNLLVWSAIDGKEPQLFATLVDQRGQKIAQRMITRSRGEIESVTAEASGNDWIVGWVNHREGVPEAYVTRLSPTLGRRHPDVRVGQGTSNTVQVDLAIAGDDEVWHLRSDSGEDSVARIYLSRLQAKTLKTLAERRLSSEAEHCHSPRFLTGEHPPRAAWICEQAGRSRLEIAKLTVHGELEAAPVRWETDASIAAFSAHCQEGPCRIIATAQNDQTQFLQALELDSGRLGIGVEVLSVLSPKALLVAPVLGRTDAWYYDLGLRGQPRVHRARLQWRQ